MKKYLLTAFCVFNLTRAFAILGTPSLVAPVFGSQNNSPALLIEWSGVTGATDYEYKLSTDSLFSGANIITISGANQTYIFDLYFGTVYYWQVRALKTSPPLDSSAWSTIWSFSTFDQLLPLAPMNGATNQQQDVTLDWGGISGIFNYSFERDTVATFNSPLSYYNSITGPSSQVGTANLRFGTQYFWRVRALNSVDTSEWSTTWSFTTVDTLIQTAPINGSLNQTAEVGITWNNTAGYCYHDYERDTTATFNSPLHFVSSAPVPGALNINLRFGTQYFWRVRAHNAIDTSQWSAIWNFTTIDQLLQTAPVNGAVNQTPNATLDWNSTIGVYNYDFQWDTVTTFNSPLNFYASVGTTSQVNAAYLRFGTQYFWRVRARHYIDTTQWSSTWSFTTVDQLSLLAPINNAVSVSLNPTIGWTGTTGITGYEYQYSTSSNFSNPILFTIGTNSQAVLSNLSYGTQYFWQVRAFHSGDTSAWSLPWSFTTLYQLTTAPNLISPTNNIINIPAAGASLQWSSVNNATTYEYQYDTDVTLTNPVSNSISSLNDLTGALLQNTIYYWRVRAGNSLGFSPWSATWSFTTEVVNGIDNQIKTNSFQVNPNPSNGVFNVATLSNLGTIEIYNIIGKQVYASEIKFLITTIDLSSEPAGLYFLRCSIDGKIKTEKLIVK